MLEYCFQDRVQYHDLSNNNTAVVGVERQDSYNSSQHQVYSPVAPGLVSSEQCIPVEPDTTMVTSGHALQGKYSIS